MPDSNITENEFLSKLTGIIEDNLSNEQFGVSELAYKFGMSRSNLLRKVKKAANLSVSQFIRNVRLKNAMEMLKQNDMIVSEVSYAVGFGSTSYFTKCFHDHFGFPPGEVGKNDFKDKPKTQLVKSNKKRNLILAASVFFIIIVLSVIYFITKQNPSENNNLEKSIAVLPFKNDSDDVSNVYIVNGLMESVLNNLQKIEDLKVISRTSVEKFRTNPKTIPEIANELKVSYIVEGSGQKIDDKIFLNIQLIEATTDNHLWSEQFERKTSDIFNLQKEVAKKIAEKIEVIITPDEQSRIEKTPTNNLIAYDFFLKGLEQINQGTREGLDASIVNFKKAIKHDSEFARAYAAIAMAYYYLDVFQTVKKYKDEINFYADKALLHDPKLPQSLIAKSLFYQSTGDCSKAIPYLEKALEYNPNYAKALNFLSDIYATCIPNTGKYLENAIRGLQLDIAANDSTTTSFNYLHVSNAFVQSGFVEKAENYINKSLDYNPNNLFSEYVKAYILYAKENDLQKTKERLLETFKKDTMRLDVMQEIAKIHYYMRDYKGSYKYYKKLNDAKEKYNLDIYRHINGEIGLVYAEMDLLEESKKYFADYKNYIDGNTSIYKNVELAMYYSYFGETQKALKHFEQFVEEEDDYHYWTILFLKMDPLIDTIKDEPEFQKYYEKLELKFWGKHDQIKRSLINKKLIKN